MKKRFILFTVISFALIGCSQVQKTQTVTTSSSLHNYDFEMITEALKNHPDFPKLTLNESSKIEEVVYQKNTYNVTYSWETEVISHGSTVVTDPKDEDIVVWTEDSSADYYITLIKDWETEDGRVKSYWKYKYIPHTNEIELIESEDNDYKINE
ncbi:hypothetical protein [Ureibacillus manganicus]|uniref:Lipoprotein n=1 Tax=Ureibacillus manganicus DSM 26584 TaxID=1384049 RepID=A0A0A3I2N3_9BACL|nr:hypothetical protein [Ureibacillus manganicus]KGR79086.1 hypothetical protein CD29_08775 [Ureibacillus manganicus DSM 26584]